ncbi:MAG: hypothetical protein HY900_30715 [Deltaproteobacteria bacterium]|nr:hypothetical protein [Deltaproteobacteria bacterium]
MRYIAAVVAVLTLLVSTVALADRGQDGHGRGHGHGRHEDRGAVVEFNGVVTSVPGGLGTVIIGDRPIVVERETIIRKGFPLERGCAVVVRGFDRNGHFVAEEIIVKHCG